MSIEEILEELQDSKDYLLKVESEVIRRSEALKANQQEQKKIQSDLVSVNLERNLRLGRVMHLQAVELYRRRIHQDLEKLQQKEQQLKEDLKRALERKEQVNQEIQELSNQLNRYQTESS